MLVGIPSKDGFRILEENMQTIFKILPIENLQRGQYQPRQAFDEDALHELAQSILAQGLIEPPNFSVTDILTVRPDHNHARSQRYVDQTPMEELWPGKHVIDARALHRLALEAAAAKSSAPMSQDKTEKPGSIDKPSSPRSSFFSSGKEIASVDGVTSTIGHLVTPQ